MLKFVRYADKLMSALDEEDSADKQEFCLGVLADAQIEGKGAEKLTKIAKFMHVCHRKYGSKEAVYNEKYLKAAAMFDSAFRAYKEHYTLHIENELLKSMLDVSLPLVVERLRTRGINPDSPDALSSKIEIILGQRPEGLLPELRLYQELAIRWEKAFMSLFERKVIPKKLLRSIKELRAQLKYDMHATRKILKRR